MYTYSHSYNVYMLRRIYVLLFSLSMNIPYLNNPQYHQWCAPTLSMDIETTVGAFLWIQKELERKVLKTYNLIKYYLFTMLHKLLLYI